MDIIEIKKNYKDINLGRERNLATLILKLEDNRYSSNVTLDISGCVIDYPSTSQLIDFFLNQLEKMDGPKELKIIYNIDFKEYTILHYLILGSKYFDIHSKIRVSELDKWKDIINNKLKNINCLMTISLTTQSNNIEYKYGKK